MFFAFFCCAIWAFLQRYRCFEAFTSALQLCSSWLIRPSFVPHSSLVPCEEPVHWMAWLGLCFARPRTWDVSVASAAFRNIRSTDFSGLDGKNEEYSGQLTQLTSDDIDIVKFQLWIDWIWSKIWDQLFPVVSGDDWLFGMREALGGKEKCSPQRYPEISRGDIDFDDFESINRDISPDIWTIFDEFDWIRHDQTWSDSKALDLVGTTKSSCYRCFFPWWVPWQAASSWSADIGPKGAGHAMVFAHHPLGSCGALWRSLWVIWVWVNTYRYIFSGMNIHLPAILGFTIGTRVLTHPHFFQIKHSQYITFTIWLWLTVRYGKIHHL